MPGCTSGGPALNTRCLPPRESFTLPGQRGQLLPAVPAAPATPATSCASLARCRAGCLPPPCSRRLRGVLHAGAQGLPRAAGPHRGCVALRDAAQGERGCRGGPAALRRGCPAAVMPPPVPPVLPLSARPAAATRSMPARPSPSALLACRCPSCPTCPSSSCSSWRAAWPTARLGRGRLCSGRARRGTPSMWWRRAASGEEGSCRDRGGLCTVRVGMGAGKRRGSACDRSLGVPCPPPRRPQHH